MCLNLNKYIFSSKERCTACVNLYKYVNSTGIADGLFDWLLKCYTHTGVEDYSKEEGGETLRRKFLRRKEEI